jgi:hypothetical protein
MDLALRLLIVFGFIGLVIVFVFLILKRGFKSNAGNH